MNFYTKEHLFHCGVDLHARSMYICVLDHSGQIQLHRNLPAQPQRFLDAIAPFRQEIFVCAKTVKTDLSCPSPEPETNWPKPRHENLSLIVTA